jgi:tRNA-specific 2-thiouridylase
MKILVAMSGGVDSSVTAYLLRQQGHEVTGLSFELWDRRGLGQINTCCSVETINLARTVASRLGMEHMTVDVRDAFYSLVIEPFCESYIEGTTPNPCILCNKFIKFDFLLQKADEIGANLVATGHYARRIEKDGRYLLARGVDRVKDQSYVLYVMTRKHLARTIFPLGGMEKRETREIAARAGLATALRTESQEICFVGDDKYADFIRGVAPEAVSPGPIYDTSGRRLGEHKGIAFYTIGQRRGLGIASSHPLYVIRIDRKNNAVIVGPREEALVRAVNVGDLNWISGEAAAEEMRISAKIRSTMKDAPAVLIPVSGNTVRVEFDEPQWAPAPGQSAVFYDGEIVLGGGIIT